LKSHIYDLRFIDMMNRLIIQYCSESHNEIKQHDFDPNTMHYHAFNLRHDAEALPYGGNIIGFKLYHL